MNIESPGVDEKLQALEGAVRRQADRFAAVLEMGAQLSSARDIDALLQLSIERLTQMLAADAATLFMLDEARGELWSRVLRGSTLGEIRISRTTGVAGHVVTTGRTLALGDAYQDPRFHSDVDRASGFRTSSVIAAPLRHVSGRVLGVVEVLSHKVNAFTPEDVAVVEAISTQIAGVLDNVLLLEQLKRQNEQLTRAQGELSQALAELDLLYELEKATSSAERQDELLDQILERSARALRSNSASILLSDDERGSLYFRTARGDRSERLRSLSLRPGQGIAGQVAVTGKPMRVAKADECPFYDASVAQSLGVTIEAVLCVPILVGETVVGALELFNKPGGYDEADERLAILLAGQTGRAILLRRNREEEERRGRLAAIGQMLSGVMHDLRTPMTIISGYAQLMANEKDANQRADFARIIEKQFDQINGMTRETLAFARGERALLLRTVHLQKFLQEIEEYLRKDFERSRVTLTVEAGYIGSARFDETKIKRVVYNLARNAAQAMPNGGRFVLSTTRLTDQLVFRFADDGPGIPPEIAGKLFRSFVTAGKKDGTGLGLAIVKKIVDEHGGVVTCESAPGKGTTFEVRLPLEVSEGQKASAA
jgi:signal transduction histidine kinase